MQYHIYHAVKPIFEAVESQPRQYVGYVEADTLNEAFALSQNFDKSWNPYNPCRSTSVGDVIHATDGFHLVCGNGFKKLNY